MSMNQPALWGAVFNIGNAATAATTTWDEIDAGLSSVATLQDGRLVCVWRARDAQGHDSVEARFLNADGSPDGQAFKVNILESDHFAAPQVEVLANGDFVVAYSTPAPDPSVIHPQA